MSMDFALEGSEKATAWIEEACRRQCPMQTMQHSSMEGDVQAAEAASG